MKIRNGFVSNSSSSSFVIIMTKVQHNDWLDTLNIYEKQVVSELDITEKKLADIDIVVLMGSEGNYSFYEDISLDMTEEDEALTEYEFCDKYDIRHMDTGEFWSKAEEKLPDDIISTSFDF